MQLKRLVKRMLYHFLRMLPLDGMLAASQSAAAGIARLIFFRDWTLQAYGWPQFFKHQINLARWRAEPRRWSFVARGVYAREQMFRGCTVLDLCCGDGTYSRLFFADIASRIDAVDKDRSAVAYARRYNGGVPIAYHEMNILTDPFPHAAYDFVIWNAAICYFSLTDIQGVMRKIVRSGSAGMQLCGMLPKGTGYVDHKTEFADADSVTRLLRQHFEMVTVNEIDELCATTFYFRATHARRETA